LAGALGENIKFHFFRPNFSLKKKTLKKFGPNPIFFFIPLLRAGPKQFKKN